LIVVTEHRSGPEFLGVGRELLEVLARADGFERGELGRSPDDPGIWLVVTRWRDAGSMRRGFGGFEAKVAAAPVMVSASDRVSGFEVLVEVRDGTVLDRSSDLAGQ
jgi:heme-degrading monooxygenase HmoA